MKSQNVKFLKYSNLALILLSSIHPALAQSTNRQIGTQFTVTADPSFVVQQAVGGTCPAGSWSGSVYTTGPITADCSANPIKPFAL